MNKISVSRVSNLAHLNSTKLGAIATKNIILDALYFINVSIEKDNIPALIQKRFGINMPIETVSKMIDELSHDKMLDTVDNKFYSLNHYIKAELTSNVATETAIKLKAVEAWLDNADIFPNITSEQRDAMEKSIDPFLDKVFVIHGAASYKLLGTSLSHQDFDINSIANEISQTYPEHLSFVCDKLPTIFSLYTNLEIITYLKLKVNKAVSYLSSVMSLDTYAHICDRLKDFTLYLDTSVLYRLLNLQGEHRFFSVKNTIDACQKNGIICKATAETYAELKARIKFDSKVLVEHPIKTDLAMYGYKYRTSDNYVSSYWERAAKTGISVSDYNEFYNNVDIILEGEYHIEIEKVIVEEESFVNTVQDFYSKINTFDTNNEKTPNSAWHDAYCLAYVKKQQLKNVSNAIDAKCLFLTTDDMLIKLQERNYELKENIPLLLIPSQLLQLFSFTTDTGDYADAFSSLFSSASISRNNSLYTNDDIQEILSRISHYDSYSANIAEKVLESQLVSSKYKSTSNDAEKEEIIYNEISSELLLSIKQSEEKNSELQGTNKTFEKTIQRNETTFSIFRADIDSKNEIIESQQAIINRLCKNHVDKKWKRWHAGHLLCFCISIVLELACIGLLIYILGIKGLNFGDLITIIELVLSGIFIGIGIPLFRFGFKVFTPNIESNIRKQYKDEYLSNGITDEIQKLREPPLLIQSPNSSNSF